ncbi:hypothetical protein HG530_008726 [Fusarium avenaceum]|nr:hypothetical protein HG530_008726 [Fusarium avenaceum]
MSLKKGSQALTMSSITDVLSYSCLDLVLSVLPLVQFNLLNTGSLNILLLVAIVFIMDTGNSVLESTATLLRAKHGGKDDAENNDSSSNTHDRAVCLDLVTVSDGDECLFRNGVDDLGGGG